MRQCLLGNIRPYFLRSVKFAPAAKGWLASIVSVAAQTRFFRAVRPITPTESAPDICVSSKMFFLPFPAHPVPVRRGEERGRVNGRGEEGTQHPLLTTKTLSRIVARRYKNPPFIAPMSLSSSAKPAMQIPHRETLPPLSRPLLVRKPTPPPA